jgi:hypothetical protein
MAAAAEPKQDQQTGVVVAHLDLSAVQLRNGLNQAEP